MGLFQSPEVKMQWNSCDRLPLRFLLQPYRKPEKVARWLYMCPRCHSEKWLLF